MEEIYNVFESATEINVYNNGVKASYCAGGTEYNDMLAEWNKMIDGAHQMPAFGVSINDLTLKEMKKGLWVEFCFDKQLECGGLPFEKLLINVNKQYYGFNLIRYNAEYGYDGRCFYFDLVGKNMDNFYDLLLNL